MRMRAVLLAALCAAALRAQSGCQAAREWSPCEITIELSAEALKAHPKPAATVELWGEFRSPAPKSHTRRLPAYWDGGRRMVVRFTPDDAGVWTYRISGNVPEVDGKEGQFTAAENNREGLLRPANLHFWYHPDTLAPHLWMGDDHADLFTIPRAAFDRLATARVAQKFTHLRGRVLTPGVQPFRTPDEPNLDFFAEMDSRMRALDEKGLTVDLTLAADAGTLEHAFPTWAQRERFLRYIVGRYDAFNVSWEIASSFEGATGNRNIIRELGVALHRYDPYKRPSSCGAQVTSSPLLGDKWMSHIVENSPDPAVAAIEHQQYPWPLISTGFAPAGTTGAAFRKALWDATMAGTWPVSRIAEVENAETRAMQTWAETIGETRYWEMEPYFELDGGKALALSGVEYLVYIEKPGPLSLFVEKHGYDVYWINPATGERSKGKDWKGEEFTDEPPDRTHDWLLHLSRDGHKAGMAKSYKFESQPNQLQEVETSLAKIPYELAEPKADETTLVPGHPAAFRIKLKKETKGTRRMTYLLTGEIVLDGAGMRVLGTGTAGALNVPPEMLANESGVLNVRIEALNAAGKLYALDVVFPVKKGGP